MHGRALLYLLAKLMHQGFTPETLGTNGRVGQPLHVQGAARLRVPSASDSGSRHPARDSLTFAAGRHRHQRHRIVVGP